MNTATKFFAGKLTPQEMLVLGFTEKEVATMVRNRYFNNRLSRKRAQQMLVELNDHTPLPRKGE